MFAATATAGHGAGRHDPGVPGVHVATTQTIDRVDRFAQTTQPLIDELRPAARQLSPALQQVAIFAPELRDLMDNLAPLTQASKAGVPAFEQFLERTPSRG